MLPKRLKYHLKIWWLMSKNSFLMVLTQKVVFVIFLIGKIIRFGMFVLFLIFILRGASGLAGYTTNQTIFFFLTFNFVDIVSQFLFREVYRFRPEIVSGNFDLTLVKPVSALFRSLMGGADVIDLVTIPPLIFAMVWVGGMLTPSLAQVVLFIALLVNGLLIAAAFHIAVLALGIITLEIDHTVMIYRDLINMGRFPIDIYREPLRGILTFLIPVGLMITFPAKALMGLSSMQGIVISFAVTGAAIFLSLKFWKLALRKYTSASS